MKYFVTNVSKAHYSSSKVAIKPSAEVEVEKEVYDYLNDVYGASGKFTFRTDSKSEVKTKKATKVDKPKATKEVKVTKPKETKPKK